VEVQVLSSASPSEVRLRFARSHGDFGRLSSFGELLRAEPSEARLRGEPRCQTRTRKCQAFVTELRLRLQGMHFFCFVAVSDAATGEVLRALDRYIFTIYLHEV
jgi:hypothetical protein